MTAHSLLKTLLYKAGFSIKKIRARPRPAASENHVPNEANVIHLLHQENPYEKFDFHARPLDLQGWGSDSPAFREFILALKPNLIVEVGTWKGGSAIHMAEISRELGLQTQILCIDTWLGALEFWTNHDDLDRYMSLGLRNGYPSVYYQFLANVCHKHCQDRIVPFPQTSSTAALWLRHYGISAKLIYLDASHEEEDVYQDLVNFWEIVAENGILFGDDYSWDGVRLAVNRFVQEENLEIQFSADKWFLRKS